MHGKDPFSDFREFINTMESRVQELGKAYGVEHLAGPQGFAVRYLFENQDNCLLYTSPSPRDRG